MCVCYQREVDSSVLVYFCCFTVACMATAVTIPVHARVCMCVFCRNVGGGFIAYFNLLQKAFSQNRHRWREIERREGKKETGE